MSQSARAAVSRPSTSGSATALPPLTASPPACMCGFNKHERAHRKCVVCEMNDSSALTTTPVPQLALLAATTASALNNKQYSYINNNNSSNQPSNAIIPHRPATSSSSSLSTPHNPVNIHSLLSYYQCRCSELEFELHVLQRRGNGDQASLHIIDELKTNNSDLKHKLTIAEQDIYHFQTQHHAIYRTQQQYKKFEQDMKYQMKLLQDKNSEYEKKIEYTTKLYNDMSLQRDSLDKHKHRYELRISALSHELAELNNTHDLFMQQHAQLNAKHTELTKNHAELLNKYHTLQEDNSQLTLKHNHLMALHHDLQQEKHEALQTIMSLHENIKALKINAENQHELELKQNITIDNLKCELQQLQSLSSSHDTSHREVLEQHRHDAHDLKTKHIEMSNQIAYRNNKNEELSHKYQESEKSRIEFEIKHDKLLLKYSTQDIEFKKLSQLCDEYATKKDEWKHKHDKLSEEYANSKHKLSEQSQHINDLTYEISQLKLHIDGLHKKLNDALTLQQQQAEHYHRELKNYYDKRNNLQNEMEEYQNKNHEIKRQFDSLNKTISQLQADLSEEKKQHDFNKIALKTNEDSLKNLNNEYSNYQDMKKQEISDLVSQHKSELEQREKSYNFLETQYHTVESNFHEFKKVAKRNEEEAESKLKNLQYELKVYLESQADLKRDIESRMLEIENLKDICDKQEREMMNYRRIQEDMNKQQEYLHDVIKQYEFNSINVLPSRRMSAISNVPSPSNTNTLPPSNTTAAPSVNANDESQQQANKSHHHRNLSSSSSSSRPSSSQAHHVRTKSTFKDDRLDGERERDREIVLQLEIERNAKQHALDTLHEAQKELYDISLKYDILQKQYNNLTSKTPYRVSFNSTTSNSSESAGNSQQLDDNNINNNNGNSSSHNAPIPIPSLLSPPSTTTSFSHIMLQSPNGSTRELEQHLQHSHHHHHHQVNVTHTSSSAFKPITSAVDTHNSHPSAHSKSASASKSSSPVRSISPDVLAARSELISIPLQFGLHFHSTPAQNGLIVTQINKADVAARLNLQLGDVILSVNNHITKHKLDFLHAVQQLYCGDVIPIQVERDGEILTLNVVLEGKGYSQEQVEELRARAQFPPRNYLASTSLPSMSGAEASSSSHAASSSLHPIVSSHSRSVSPLRTAHLHQPSLAAHVASLASSRSTTPFEDEHTKLHVNVEVADSNNIQIVSTQPVHSTGSQ